MIPGMNSEMKLRKHQLDFVARVIYTGTGLAAHEVGAGKTAALIAAGMYLKNLGAIHKAVFVVPNPLVGQWATEFYRFFPNANLLVSTVDDFTPKNRNRYVSKIATGEYDAVILAHSQFEKIPISRERQIMQLEQQINEIEAAISEMKYEKGENWSIKQMAIFRENLETKLEKLSAEEKKDDLLTFEQLGVDMMFVDEAHFYKNCFVFTKLRNVAGITTSSSQRAFDMLLKCQYLQEVNNGRGVVFATGTMISNSISELFVMQRYLQPQELERFGWSYFDTWIAHFAKRTSVLELRPEGGGYRMRDRFVRFYNLPELMAVLREVADIKTADMLDIPGLPAIQGGKAQIIPTEATPAQKAIMAEFILRADAIRAGRVKPEEDIALDMEYAEDMIGVEAGSVIKLSIGDQEIPVTVSGLFLNDGLQNGHGPLALDNTCMVATKELFQEAMPMIDCFDYSWSIVSDPQKAEQIENSLSAIISSDPDLALDTIGIHKDYEEMENRVVFGGFQALSWLVFLFGVVNLINTTLSNQMSRKRENSVFRAIGLTRKQLCQMTIYEGICYAFFAALATLAVGLPIAVIFARKFSEMTFHVAMPYSFPFLQMGLFVLVLFGLEVILSFWTMRRQKNQSLVEEMRAME